MRNARLERTAAILNKYFYPISHLTNTHIHTRMIKYRRANVLTHSHAYTSAADASQEIAIFSDSPAQRFYYARAAPRTSAKTMRYYHRTPQPLAHPAQRVSAETMTTTTIYYNALAGLLRRRASASPCRAFPLRRTNA